MAGRTFTYSEDTLDPSSHLATEEKQDDIITALGGVGGLSGAGTHGSITCNPANTWVQLPASVITSNHVIVFKSETKTGVIRWSFSNAGTPSATAGEKLEEGVAINLAANQVIYVGSTVNTDTVNYTTKII